MVIDEPVANVSELRGALRRYLPEAGTALDDPSWNVTVNGQMPVSYTHLTPTGPAWTAVSSARFNAATRTT